MFGSINVSGLRNAKKRQNIFNWLQQKKKYHLVLLQETHCGNSDEESEWSKEWAGFSKWCNRTRLSRGVAILVREYTPIKVKSSTGYNDGRIISIKAEINEMQIQIINIYAPNNPLERKQFIGNLQHIIDINCINVIAGDFNLALNCTLDREPSRYSNDHGYNELIELMKNYNLEDILRKRNPDKKCFTFTRGPSKSRIGFSSPH